MFPIETNFTKQGVDNYFCITVKNYATRFLQVPCINENLT